MQSDVVLTVRDGVIWQMLYVSFSLAMISVLPIRMQGQWQPFKFIAAIAASCYFITFGKIEAPYKP